MHLQVPPQILLLRLSGGLGVRVHVHRGPGPVVIRGPPGVGCCEGGHVDQLYGLHSWCIW